MIKYQIACGPMAALNIAFKILRGFLIRHLDIRVLIVYRLGSDYFEKCHLREATKNISHIEA